MRRLPCSSWNQSSNAFLAAGLVVTETKFPHFKGMESLAGSVSIATFPCPVGACSPILVQDKGRRTKTITSRHFCSGLNIVYLLSPPKKQWNSVALYLTLVQDKTFTAEPQRTQRRTFFVWRIEDSETFLEELPPNKKVHVVLMEAFVIQSPLTIGSQKQISLCDLCGSAVNLFLISANVKQTVVR